MPLARGLKKTGKTVKKQNKFKNSKNTTGSNYAIRAQMYAKQVIEVIDIDVDIDKKEFD
jgi:hypothetical protein